ncbi:MHS family alpha-ketoglutarate permease-like MFS transporter [Kitasatospora gansuensis]|uniref:MHS family alpha-ketoglutarate permease-like MFS transporter n=1 Tax=Kitasatospora gansuensis TaxID=258050 RepID=A0A7W7WJ62_9ACTN|nr:MFS transporter [Kitasatospora gansuensis]MBB4948823.1 MHS family alpha-ketoglutarate permease-like MFS transporter [Kitasatospora gansuensis]
MPHRPDHRSVSATVVGNFVEAFDWLAYGLFAPLFAVRFFPSANPVTALLGAFAVLGIGVLARPLGGVLLGRFADRRGRRPALMLSIGLMTGGSVLIGVAPTYQQVGMVAPAVLLLGRVAQGVSHGGEWPSAVAYLMELAPRQRRCFYGSLFALSTVAGAFTASLLGGGLTAALGAGAMADWGWRVPFLVGGVFGLVLLLLRNRLTETEVFRREVLGHAARGSLRLLFGGHRRRVLRSVLFVAGVGAVGNTWTAVIPAMGQRLAAPGTMYWVVVCVTGTMMLAAVPLGLLADRIGAVRLLVGASCGFAVAGSWTYLHLTGGFLSLVLTYGSGLVYLMCVTTVLPKILSESFPPEVRALGIGLPYALTTALLGAAGPASATWLAERGASGWFVGGMAVAVLLALPAAASAGAGQPPAGPPEIRGAEPGDGAVLPLRARSTA